MGKLSFSNHDLSKLVFNPTIKGEKNNKGDVFHEVEEGLYKKLLFTTPKLRCTTSENHVTFVVDEGNRDFLNFLVDLDDKVESGAIANKATWFSGDLTDEDVSDRYKGSVRTSREKGHVLSTKISSKLKIYDLEKEPLNHEDVLADDLCIGMVELDCINMGKNTFKNEYTIHHLKVIKKKEKKPAEICGESFVDSETLNIDDE